MVESLRSQANAARTDILDTVTYVLVQETDTTSERLLITKLHVPPVPPGWLTRSRLIKRLDAALRCRLTLVCAPAGFGKTTL